MKKPVLLLALIFALAMLACRAAPWEAGGTAVPLGQATITAESHADTPTSTLAPPAPTAAPTLTPLPTERPPVQLSFISAVETLESKDPPYTVTLAYPGLEAAAPFAPEFNSLVRGKLDQVVEQFKKDALDASLFPNDVPGSFLDLTYQEFYNQDGLASQQLHLMVYIKGAAHPNSVTIPLNFDFRAGRELALADLFVPGSPYLEKLFELCLADLQTRGNLPLFLEGAQPKPENYRSWNITPQGLRVTFDPYQVAAYAAGPQIVEIGWEQLSGLLAPGLGLPPR